MIKTIFLILSFTFLASHSLAHESAPGQRGHEHSHSCKGGGCSHDHEFNQFKDPEERAIARLAHVLHEAIEGEHFHLNSLSEFFGAFKHKEQWVRLVKQLNFNKTARRAVRAFNMESDKEHLRDHVKNLSLLFPASHMIEMAASPLFIALGSIGGFPALAVGAGGALLSIIAVPGLDPLCILLLASYPLRRVHRTVNFVREGLESRARAVIFRAGFDRLFQASLTETDRFEAILKGFEKSQRLVSESSLFTQESSEHPRKRLMEMRDVGSRDLLFKIETDFNPSDKREFIKTIFLAEEQLKSGSLAQALIRLFPWNARGAMREVMRVGSSSESQRKLESEFYMERVQWVAGKGLTATFKNDAIHLSAPLKLRNPWKNIPREPIMCSKFI